MNTKKYLLAVLAGFVGNMLVFFILEQFLLRTYMTTAIYEPAGAGMQGSPVFALGGVLISSLILAYIYPKGYEGGAPLMESTRFGVLMGLFFGFPFAFYFSAMFSTGFVPTLVLAIEGSLEVVGSGLFIGLVYGRMTPLE